MSITINGATNTLTAASGLTIAGNTAVTGTLSASGDVTFAGATSGILNVNATGTNVTRLSLLNDGGQYFFGVDNSTAAGFGGTAYAQVIYAPAGRVVETSIAGTGVITKVSPTGLAVTGTLSATGDSGAGAVSAGNRWNIYDSTKTSTTIGANQLLRIASNANGADATINFTDSTAYNSWISAKGGVLYFQPDSNGTSRAAVSSTALTLGSGVNLVMAAASTVRLGGYTVATLPAAGTAGRTAYVTDATAPTYLGALTGGGAVVCPVFDNGVAWVSA